MTSPKRIRSLERGLKVVQALSQSVALTVSQAARYTGLPRQTVSRILFSLEDLGYVERLTSGKRYSLSEKVLPIGDSVRKRSWITRIAKPEMDSLCRRVLWPVSLVIPRNLELEVVYDTESISPLVMHPIPAGLHIPMITSISGRVFLAYCEENVRNTVLNAVLKAQPRALDEVDISLPLLQEQLEGIKAKGFYCDRMPHKGHSNLAAPIFHNGNIKAVLDIRFPQNVLPISEAASDFAIPVIGCAQDITNSLNIIQ
ncbi:MAG: IclR family transcriptional regulator [Rhodospirillaceae bacterium]